MRTQTVFALAFLAATSLQAQSASSAEKPKQEHPQQAAKQGHAMASGWKQMDAFHKLLGATFHPVEKSGDLKPLRASANDLSAAAREWAASTAPANCRTEAVRTAVSTISLDALGIANQVLANAQDSELKASITKLHDKFEEVEKACGGHAGMKH
jgi:hypothetical protein